jgi:acyl transferase domain-containing protein
MDYQKLASCYVPGVTAYSATGVSLSVAAGRLSYSFGLKGPALAIDTACSSSLVAANAASMNLRSGGISRAAAAGANLTLSPDTPAMFSRAGMLSPEGRCKTLDAAADGYVRAEAVGVMMLQAFAAGAASGAAAGSLAVLVASAVNQDGRSSSLTAPNGPAQQEVLRAALADGGLILHSILGLSMHGTGTTLGELQHCVAWLCFDPSIVLCGTLGIM